MGQLRRLNWKGFDLAQQAREISITALVSALTPRSDRPPTIAPPKPSQAGPWPFYELPGSVVEQLFGLGEGDERTHFCRTSCVTERRLNLTSLHL